MGIVWEGGRKIEWIGNGRVAKLSKKVNVNLVDDEDPSMGSKWWRFGSGEIFVGKRRSKSECEGQ